MADNIPEDMAVFSSRRAYRHRMRYRVLRAVLLVIRPGHFFPPYQKRVPPEIPVSVKHLCKAVGKDAVPSLKPLTAAIDILLIHYYDMICDKNIEPKCLFCFTFGILNCLKAKINGTV